MNIFRRAINAIKSTAIKTKNYFYKIEEGRTEAAENTASSPYNSLSPVDNADPDGQYSAALLWALQNREQKDIKNIALTGPYGSGKSSIIKTFEKNNTDDSLVFLNISLATFKEEKPIPENLKPEEVEDNNSENNKKNKPDAHTTLLRLIELSILQQIFYHEEDEDIPDTRFKKTRSFPNNKVRNLAIILSIFGFALLCQVFPNLLQKSLRFKFYPWIETTLHYITLTVVVVGAFIILWKSIRPLRSIQLKKFNFQDAEFGVDENISKSILNEHLDEILYFFEVTDYTVVVIEDLDRFEQTEIFTKLRELNLLINYSKKIKRKVTFIYAVRDDMFRDKDRTKFFDFIIPVIPVINYSNSNEILLEIVGKNGYDVNPDLIEDISLFVDDMRLLYNIMNEYYLYQQKLNAKLSKKLDASKLLAMVVYKNIYPHDFISLSNNEGVLYTIFQQKNSYYLDQDKVFQEEILKVNKQIKEIENAPPINENELRKLYVLEYINVLTGYTSFIYDEEYISATEACKENYFEYFVQNKMKYRSRNANGYQYDKDITNQFAAIENLVDKSNSYEKRLKIIIDKKENKIEELKGELAVIEKKKNKMRHLPLHELAKMEVISFAIEDKKQQQLLGILLRAGYIDESYLDYVSIFYEGSITKADKEFLLNVKAYIRTDYGYEISKIENLISKIPAVHFDQEYILNYKLVDFILANPRYSPQRKKIFSLLSDETLSSTKFINGYLDHGTEVETFVKLLAKAWIGIWNFISEKSNYNEDRVSQYFRSLIEYADVSDLLKISEVSDFKWDIADQEHFLTLLPDQDKLAAVIKELQVKFTNLEMTDVPQKLSELVYNGNYYLVNNTMIETILRYKSCYEPEGFKTRNFSLIMNSGLKNLIDYVDSRISRYIQSVWLKIETSKDEDEAWLVHLLNHHDVEIDDKVKIVEQIDTKVGHLSAIDDKYEMGLLLAGNRTKATWENLLHYYVAVGEVVNDNMIKFINEEENAMELSQSEVDTGTKDEKHNVLVKKFAKELLLNDYIKSGSYFYLIKSLPKHYQDLEVTDLSVRKVELLIKNRTLLLSVANYDRLRSKYFGKHIELAELTPSFFVKNINDKFTLEEEDALVVMHSTKFSSAEKNIIINHLADAVIMENLELSNAIGEEMIKEPTFEVSMTVLNHLVAEVLPINLKIKLFNTRMRMFSKTEIEHIIEAWGFPYAEIAIKGKRPWMEATVDNQKLIENLKKAGLVSKSKPEKEGIRISTFSK